MIPFLFHALNAIDPDQQAQRSADAAWESARWTFVYVLLTAGLLVGAFLAARYAKKTWEDTNAQLKMVRIAEREREAVNVSAWLQPAKGLKDIEVYVRNGNGGPVFDVTCRVFAKRANEAVPTQEVRVHPYLALGLYDPAPTVKYAFPMSPDEYVFGYEDPKDKVRYTKNRTTSVRFETEDEWKIWDGRPATDGLAVDLAFRDSSGRSWRRDWHGKLTEVG